MAKVLQRRFHLFLPNEVPGGLNADELAKTDIADFGGQSRELGKLFLQRIVESFILLNKFSKLLINLLAVGLELQVLLVVKPALCSLL